MLPQRITPLERETEHNRCRVRLQRERCLVSLHFSAHSEDSTLLRCRHLLAQKPQESERKFDVTQGECSAANLKFECIQAKCLGKALDDMLWVAIPNQLVLSQKGCLCRKECGVLLLPLLQAASSTEETAHRRMKCCHWCRTSECCRVKPVHADVCYNF